MGGMCFKANSSHEPPKDNNSRGGNANKRDVTLQN